MNDRRAHWAEMTLEYFMNLTGTDRLDAISDLLTDIEHLCDRKPEIYDSFERNYRRSIGQYIDETTDTDEE